MKDQSDSYGVYVTHYIFVEHCPSASLVDQFQKPKILLQRADLWRRSLSVFDHLLEECFELCGVHVLEGVVRITKGGVTAKA